MKGRVKIRDLSQTVLHNDSRQSKRKSILLSKRASFSGDAVGCLSRSHMLRTLVIDGGLIQVELAQNFPERGEVYCTL
jgi:hypothetical protein